MISYVDVWYGVVLRMVVNDDPTIKSLNFRPTI